MRIPPFSPRILQNVLRSVVRSAPEGLDRVYLVSGGSEAIEAALKLARQYFTEVGEPERCKIIAREQSYHGNTLGALAAGAINGAVSSFLLTDRHAKHIPPC